MAILLPALVFLLPLLITPGILFHYDITPRVVILSLMVAGCLSDHRVKPSSLHVGDGYINELLSVSGAPGLAETLTLS